MKKYISIIILVVIILSCSVSTVYAGFGGGSRPGTFGTGGFSTTTVNTLLTYNELTELAIDINSRIINGDFNNVPPFSNHPNNYAVTVGVYNDYETPLRYVLYVTYSSTKYYFKNNSGGLYYAYADTDNPAVSKPILEKLEQIRSQLVIANNTLTSISTKITNYIVTNIDDIESSLSTLNTSASNIYNRLGDMISVVRKNYYFGYKSDADNVDYPTIPISWNTANSICSYLNNNFNHNGTINYISVSNQVGAQYTFYHARVASSGYIVVNVYEGGSAHDFVVCDRNHNCYKASDDSSYDHISTSLTSINNALDDIIGNTDDNIYVTLYTTDSNGNQYSTLSYRPEIIDGIISYLTTYMQNKPLKVLARDGTAGVVSQDVRYFMLANFNNGYIRLRVKLANGSYGYAYLSTPNRVLIKYDNTYVDDTTFLNNIVNAFNDNNIIDAIDHVYDWLDNADLATNQTIIDVVQDYSNDVDNSVDWASQILDLFKAVFVFDRPGPSFSGILSYFSNLGSDPS